MPFNRLVAAVDAWAEMRPGTTVLAQIGATEYTPSHIETVFSLTPSEFVEQCQRAQFIIAHAGMGSILTALQYGKPIVVMPRKGALRETRNDHQLASAKWLRSIEGIFFADDEFALVRELDAALSQTLSPKVISANASDLLIQNLQRFIDSKTSSGR